jgi:hypothetical protein
MCWAAGLILCTLVAIDCPATEGSEWSALAPLTGDGAIGSPGGTHPLAMDGDTVHFVWAQGGTVHCRRSDDAGATWTHSTTAHPLRR